MTTAALVVAILSVLAGLLTQVVQSGGTLFGVLTVPKTWLPELVVLATFVGGVSAQLATEAAPLSTAGLEQALLAGLLALSSGAAPGLARFAHHVVPAHVMEAKRVIREAAAARAAQNKAA